MAISDKFSKRAPLMQTAVIRKILAQANAPDFIHFTVGKPTPHLFPYDLTYQQTGHIIEKYGGDAFQYSPSIGLASIRGWLADRMPPATTETTLMVAGSQQAIDLCGKLFVDPGDKVAMSSPTYPSSTGALKVYGAEFIGVDCDEDGPIPSALEHAFKQAPKLFYCNPNFANPTGVTMSLERRNLLVALAQQYDVPILEDDPYGQIRFEGESLPSLYELAPDHVIFVGSFSKVIAPGFRLGWLMAAEPVFTKLMIAKQAADLQCGTYAQTLVYEMLQTGFFEEHLKTITAYYKNQRDVMLASMETHFPAEVKFTKPKGGMFIWCELPEACDTAEILQQAMAEKVAFMPGQRFHPDSDPTNFIRFSFTMADADQIEEGIARLGRLFKQVLR